MNPNEPTELGIVQRSEGRIRVVELRGELDVISAPRLAAELRGAVEDGAQRLLVDLSGLDYIDSSGLSALLEGRRLADEVGGLLAMVCPTGVVRRVFTVTSLDVSLPVHVSRDDAVRALARCEAEQ